MSVDFVSCTPSDSAAWSLLVGCIVCSKQHCHCCWPCSCTMLRGSILTLYSIALCICRFCGLYILFHILWPVYSVARGCSVLNHILIMVMQWQIQHQAMRNSMILTFLSRLFHLLLLPWRNKRLFVIQFSSDNPAPKLYTHPLNCTLILDIHCWYPMYSLRLAPQWFTFTC